MLCVFDSFSIIDSRLFALELLTAIFEDMLWGGIRKKTKQNKSEGGIFIPRHRIDLQAVSDWNAAARVTLAREKQLNTNGMERGAVARWAPCQHRADEITDKQE